MNSSYRLILICLLSVQFFWQGCNSINSESDDSGDEGAVSQGDLRSLTFNAFTSSVPTHDRYALSPDGNTMVFMQKDQSFKDAMLYDVNTKKVIVNISYIQGSGGGRRDLTFQHAVFGKDGKIYFAGAIYYPFTGYFVGEYDIATGEFSYITSSLRRPVLSLIRSSDDSYLFWITEDGTVYWSNSNGKYGYIERPSSIVYISEPIISVSKDNSRLFVKYSSSSMGYFDLSTKVFNETSFTEIANPIGFVKDANTLLFNVVRRGSSREYLSHYSISEKKFIVSYLLSSKIPSITSAKLSLNTDYVALVRQEKSSPGTAYVSLFDVTQNKMLGTLTSNSKFTDVIFSASSQLFTVNSGGNFYMIRY